MHDVSLIQYSLWKKCLKENIHSKMKLDFENATGNQVVTSKGSPGLAIDCCSGITHRDFIKLGGNKTPPWTPISLYIKWLESFSSSDLNFHCPWI
jgi:hypothetical protein